MASAGEHLGSQYAEYLLFLFFKLEISQIWSIMAIMQEDFAKYSASKKETLTQGVAAVFDQWLINVDDLGSRLTIKQDVEFIQEQKFETTTIAGELSSDREAYAECFASPNPATHETMKKMTSFSFSVFGDGKIYQVLLPTNETNLEGGYNAYRKTFTTKKHEITTVTVDIYELTQAPLWGKKVPFIQNSVENFEFAAFIPGEFNLKIWNITLF